jgi:hypothetical protein
MKKIICLILAAGFITGCVSMSHSGNFTLSANEDMFVATPNQKQRDFELEKQFDELLRKYGGSGNNIIQYMKEIAEKYCQTPFIMHYNFISDETRKFKGDELIRFHLVNDISTAVHETAHLFSDSAAYVSPEYSTSRPGRLSYSAPARITAVYLKDWGVHYIIHTNTVPAAKITPLIKDKRLLEHIRYQVYIEPLQKDNITQQYGIYGLINEYHAYYYSLIAACNIVKDPGIKYAAVHPDGSTIDYINYTDSSLPFFEFSVYILTYFRLVEKSYPGIYKELLDNHTLLEAFIRIHDASKALNNEFMKLVKAIEKDGSFLFQNEYDIARTEYLLPANQAMLAKIRETVKGF